MSVREDIGRTCSIVLRRQRPSYLFYVCFFSFIVASSSFAQRNTSVQDEPVLAPSISIGGTFSSTFSNSSIDAYSGDILCGVFTTGNGSHFSLRATFEQPLTNFFGVTAGLALRDLSSIMTTAPFSVNAFDVNTLDTTGIRRNRQYDVSLYGLGIEGGVAIHPFHNISVRGALGLYYLPKAHYTESEDLLTPSVVYTENLLSTRTISSGTFVTNNLFVAASLDLGYDLPVSSSVSFRPYLEAFAGITPVASVSSQPFRTYSMNAGVSLAYSFLPSPEPVIIPPVTPQPIAEQKKEVAPAPKPEPAKPSPAPLRVKARVVGLTDRDEEVPEPVVSVENVIVTDVSPTLGYVFFDDGSSEIPVRYHRFSSKAETSDFSTKGMYKLDAFGLNHQLLDIIGKRLTEHPHASITLTGTQSVHSAGDSAVSDRIALERAEHVASYLESVWGVEPSRIRVRSRGLPQMASDDATPTGQAENRRVEITSTSRDILEPVETKQLEQTATPPRIMFYQDIYASAGIKSNTIVIKQGGRVLQTIDKQSGEERNEWLWNIEGTNDGNTILSTNDSVTWTMQITDSLGNTTSQSGAIAIRPRVHTTTIAKRDTTDADKALERFHLLLFDYSSSSELGQNSDQVMNRLAADITPGAIVTVTGHTDITGDPAFNEKLSFDRANRASELLVGKLRSLGRNIPQLELDARGSKDILFDNSVAEGRMLSRTVRVTVERDLK